MNLRGLSRRWVEPNAADRCRKIQLNLITRNQISPAKVPKFDKNQTWIATSKKKSGGEKTNHLLSPLTRRDTFAFGQHIFCYKATIY